MKKPRLISQIANDPFLASFLTLVSGSSLAVAVSVVGQIVLVRLYPDAMFGMFDLFLAIVTPFSVIATLRYEDAIFLPESEKEAGDVVRLAAMLTVLVSVISFVLLIPAWNAIVAFLDTPGLTDWLPVVPFAIAGIALVRLAENALNRKRHYASISSGRVVQSSVTTVGQVSAGLFGPSTAGLVLPYVAARVVTTAYLLSAVTRRMPGLFEDRIRLTDLKKVLIKYVRFAQFTAPGTLLTSLSMQLPYFLLAWYFSEEIVGLFGRGHKLIALPAGLLAGAVGKIFFVNAAEAAREGRLPESVKSVFKRMVDFGFYPTLIAALFSPPLFVLVLGSDWQTAGEFARFIAPWVFLTVLSSNLTPIFDVLGQQSSDFFSGLTILVLQGVALLWAGAYGDAMFAIFVFCLAGGFLRVGHLFWLFFLSNTPLVTIWKVFWKNVVAAAPVLLLWLTISFLPLWSMPLAMLLGWWISYRIRKLLEASNPLSSK